MKLTSTPRHTRSGFVEVEPPESREGGCHALRGELTSTPRHTRRGFVEVEPPESSAHVRKVVAEVCS